MIAPFRKRKTLYDSIFNCQLPSFPFSEEKNIFAMHHERNKVTCENGIQKCIFID